MKHIPIDLILIKEINGHTFYVNKITCLSQQRFVSCSKCDLVNVKYKWSPISIKKKNFI